MVAILTVLFVVAAILATIGLLGNAHLRRKWSRKTDKGKH